LLCFFRGREKVRGERLEVRLREIHALLPAGKRDKGKTPEAKRQKVSRHETGSAFLLCFFRGREKVRGERLEVRLREIRALLPAGKRDKG